VPLRAWTASFDQEEDPGDEHEPGDGKQRYHQRAGRQPAVSERVSKKIPVIP